MEQLKTEDMIGYKSAAANMKTNVIDKLIGVKTASYDSFPPIGKKSPDDFVLKLDSKVNDTPLNIQDLPKDTDTKIVSDTERRLRTEKAYSVVDAFVPGYSKAGKFRHKVGAFLGLKSSKEAIKRAKRHHLVNHVVSEAGKVAEQSHPEVDPQLIRGGTALAAMGVNAGIDKGAKLYNKEKARKEALKRALRK